MKKKSAISHDEFMKEKLQRNPALAAEYLKAAVEDDDFQTILTALRRIAEARGGMAQVAQKAGIGRESLYRALSANGNPRLSTLQAVVKAMGLRLAIEAA
jgi:probable addiction module antidote protein